MKNQKSIIELEEIVKKFCEDRDWDQFHDAKELSIGISTEANELLQLFRFKNQEQIKDIFLKKESKEKIEDELSDVFYFILRFAQLYNIDLSETLQKKIIKNEIKYPIEFSKGNNKKYNEE